MNGFFRQKKAEINFLIYFFKVVSQIGIEDSFFENKNSSEVSIMKTNKLISVISLLGLLATSSVFAVSEEVEDQLLEKAIVESAVTKEQKTAVGNYLKAVAQQKATRAEELRELARRSTGGKFLASNVQSQKYLKQAQALEKEAQRYQSVLGSL